MTVHSQTGHICSQSETLAAYPVSHVLGLFRSIATDVVERDFQHVNETSVISELGIDSLGMLEIIGSMERELKIRISDESLTGVETIRDLLRAVELGIK